MKTSQTGLSLVEVLIALFVITVGLAGIIRLQYVSIFNNAQTDSRLTSAIAISALADNMKSAARYQKATNGRTVADQYFVQNMQNYGGKNCAGTDNFACACEALPAGLTACDTQACNDTELANYHLWQASCAVIQGNNQAQLKVQCADIDGADTLLCTPGSKISIEVSWPTDEAQANNEAIHDRCSGMHTNSACIVEDIIL